MHIKGEDKNEEFDDTISLLVSCLMSSKHGMGLKELLAEYIEQKGRPLPHVKFGFQTAIELLQSVPKKISITRDHNGMYIVRAVNNEVMADLKRLVDGQANKKKKKNKKPVSKMQKSNFNSSSMYTKPPHRKFTAFTSLSNNNNPVRDYLIHDDARSNATSVASKPNPQYGQSHSFLAKTLNTHSTYWESRQRMNNSTHTDVRGLKPVVIYPSNPLGSTKSSLNKERASEQILNALGKQPKPTSANYISNAAEHLREHRVLVVSVDECNKIYLHLLAKDFSVAYNEMMEHMNKWYSVNKKPIEKVESGTLCVAYDSKRKIFFRVVVCSVMGNEAQCFFVDEGFTQGVETSNLVAIKEEYIRLKFQAISAQIDKFTQLDTKNMQILEAVRNDLLGKVFTARLVCANPLTVSLFNDNQESYSDYFIKQIDQFQVFRPEAGQFYYAYIEYIDDGLSLFYLTLKYDFRKKYEAMMIAINEFYATKAGNTCVVRMSDIEEDRNTVFVGLFSLDKTWNRVKVLRKIKNSDSEVLVSFIDFGNKEVTDIANIRSFPSEFKHLQLLPPAAFPVSVIFKSTEEIEIARDYFYDHKIIHFKVIKVNSAGLPSIELLNLKKRSTTPTVDQQLPAVIEAIAKVELDLDEIQTINFDTLNQSNRLENTSGCKVFVRSVNNPFDFIINREESMPAYDVLMSQMKKFYTNKPEKYMVKSPCKDHVYVYLNENGDVSRIKFIDFFAGENARVYDIDAGNFEVVTDLHAIFHITRRFLKLQPLAIKARLINVNYDLGTSWSERAKVFFHELVKGRRSFKANVITSKEDNKILEVELLDKDVSLSKRLIENGFSSTKD